MDSNDSTKRLYSNPEKRFLLIGAPLILALFILSGVAWHVLSAPRGNSYPVRFVVPLNASSVTIKDKLITERHLRYSWVFHLFERGDIEPGGYIIEKPMSIFALLDHLHQPPALRWVVIPEGYRKEQIAERLALTLAWGRESVRDFIAIDNDPDSNTSEGVYFPDTYLIGVNEAGTEVAARLNRRFSEVFAPYAKEALEQNIRWQTIIKIASIIQREAAGSSDMRLISGIIWNRLLQDQKLDIDATVQYARDTYENYEIKEACARDGLALCPGWTKTYHGNAAKSHGWWRPIESADKNLSFFNTYRASGLPERPIGNPGLAAIEAALRPEETKCF